MAHLHLKNCITKRPDWILIAWLIFGIIFVTLLGALFHFVYEWSNQNYWIAPFFSVNESVWEHMKLAFWPLLIFAIFTYLFLRKRINNYITGVAEGIFLTILLIPFFFYIYTYYFDDNIIADIIIFILSIAFGFLLSYYIFKANTLPPEIQLLECLGLFVLAVAFITFTYCPPICDLFRSFVNGEYGLEGFTPVNS